MSTVYIALNINSIVGSIRNNPFIDPPVQLITEGGLVIYTENDFAIIKTDADYTIRDRLDAQILDRNGSIISMRQ